MAKKNQKNSVRYPVQERSRQTVEAILEATAQILVKEGHSKISTNAIAKKAGVSIGGLYQYFENRDAIFKDLCFRERMLDFKELQLVLERTRSQNIERSVKDVLLVSLKRFSSNPDLRRLLDSEVQYRGKDLRMKQLRKQLAGMLLMRLSELGFKKLPPDMENRLEVMIAGFEGSFYVAIEVFGKDLDHLGFVDDSAEMVLSLLRKYER